MQSKSIKSIKLTILTFLLITLAAAVYIACHDISYEPNISFSQIDDVVTVTIVATPDVDIGPDIVDIREDIDILPDIVEEVNKGFCEPDDCGGKIGATVCNHKSTDQNGDEWQLYDYWGDIVVLDFSAMWCPPCHAAAEDMQLLQDIYEDSGVQFVAILLQDFMGQLPSENSLIMWADTFGLKTIPVLANNEKFHDPTEEYGFNIEYLPTIIIIDRKRVIVYKMNGWNLTRLLNQLDSLTSI